MSLDSLQPVALKTIPCFTHTRFDYNCWWRSGFTILTHGESCHVIDHAGYPVIVDHDGLYPHIWLRPDLPRSERLRVERNRLEELLGVPWRT